MESDKFFNAINNNNKKLVRRLAGSLNSDVLESGANYASILGHDEIEDYLKMVSSRNNIYNKKINKTAKYLKKINAAVSLFDPVYEEIIKDIHNIKLKLFPIIHKWENKSVNRYHFNDAASDLSLEFRKDHSYANILIENLEKILEHEELLKEEKESIEHIFNIYSDSQLEHINDIYFPY